MPWTFALLTGLTCQALAVLMRAAAAVATIVTTATAARNVRWMAVAQMPSGIPSRMARQHDHAPVERCELPPAGQQGGAGSGDEQPDQDQVMTRRGVGGRDDGCEHHAQDPDPAGRPAGHQRVAGRARARALRRDRLPLACGVGAMPSRQRQAEDGSGQRGEAGDQRGTGGCLVSADQDRGGERGVGGDDRGTGAAASPRCR